MPQKKKTAAKKAAKKTHTKHKHINQTIIQQTLPNYSSGQMVGHQYNKDHVQFAPQTQQSHTDNIVGELVGRLMNKIENDNNKEVQQYSKEIQPMNNNTQTVNIYNKDATITEEKKSETPENIGQTIADSVSTAIRDNTRSAGEDYALQTAAGVTGLLGIGALGYAANSPHTQNAKLKLKKAGTGFLGAVTSGANAIGTAFNNNILKRGNRSGGTATTSVLADGEKQYVKSGKPGKFGKLTDEPNPLQADFDKHIEKVENELYPPKKTKEGKLGIQFDIKPAAAAPTAAVTLAPPPAAKVSRKTKAEKIRNELVPKPATQTGSAAAPAAPAASTPTPTPAKPYSILTPAQQLSAFKPQRILYPETPSLDLDKISAKKINFSKPIEVLLKEQNLFDKVNAVVQRNLVKHKIKDKINASNKLKAVIKRKVQQNDIKDLHNEASKIQSLARNYISKKKQTRPATSPAAFEPSPSTAPQIRVRRARTSIIQQHDGVQTRNIRRQTDEPHTEIQPRQYYRSDNPDYRRGQRERTRDEGSNRVRPMVEVLNPENLYNQGYFGEALHNQFRTDNIQPRNVKKGRPSSMQSQAETPARKKK